MHALNPIADAEIHDEIHDEIRERESLTTRYWIRVEETFELVLGDKCFVVEAEMRATKTGDSGEIETDPVDFRSIYVGLSDFANPIKLDEINLREDHQTLWLQLHGEVLFRLLKRAKQSDQWRTF